VAVAVAAAAIVSAGALPARATTTPGLLYPAKLVITDDQITLSRDRFAARKGGTPVPARFVYQVRVRNRGTRPFSLNILGSSTGVLAPEKQNSILVNWDRRGGFTFRALPNGPRIRVRIF
jgi:hypothetical protein